MTIGTFDGVHLGHQHVVRTAMNDAKERGLLSVVITFHPSPRSVVRPGAKVHYLSDLPERVALLQSIGPDLVVALTFDTELMRLKAQDFVDLLVSHLHLAHLVVGPDFALGSGREGTVAVLREIGETRSFTVHSLDPLGSVGTARISSTAVRRAIGEGDIAGAAAMLGRPHALHGPVMRGYQRGRDLGFPTANMRVPADRVVPADGVYVTRARLGGQTYPSVTNVGDNPTFGNPDRSVETYILDFDDDIYDQDLRIDFLLRLRGEERFVDIPALVDQIRRDVDETRSYFALHGV